MDKNYRRQGIGSALIREAERAAKEKDCYAMTLAPITWVVLSEMFPDRVRGTAMAVAVASLWTSCFGLTLTFKPINEALKAAGTFWLYAAICVVGFVVTAFFLKETKGRELN